MKIVNIRAITYIKQRGQLDFMVIEACNEPAE